MSKAGRHELEGGCTVQPPSNVQSEHAGKLAKLGHLTQAEASTTSWQGGSTVAPPKFSRIYPPVSAEPTHPLTFSRGTHDHGHQTVPSKLAKPGHFIQAEGEHHELERRGLNGSTPLRESTSYRPIDA